MALVYLVTLGAMDLRIALLYCSKAELPKGKVHVIWEVKMSSGSCAFKVIVRLRW